MKHANWPVWSLVGNAVLLTALVVMGARAPKIKTEGKAGATSSPSNGVLKLSTRPVAVPSAGAVANDADWRNWLGQLRAAGVPDKVLAGLVVSDFENRWQKQRREMQKLYDKGDLDDIAMTRALEQHDADQEEELKSALGADGFLKWDREKVLGELNLDKIQLSSSETNALYQLKKDQELKQRNLAAAHLNGEIDEADLDNQTAASEKEYDDKLKALLGDARYATLKNPDEGGQGQLARTLKALNATDPQFQAMLDAQKQWNQRRNELDQEIQKNQSEDKSYADEMHALDVARDAEYQRVLGTNGFDQLKKSQDSRYLTMQRYATAWQLTPDDIDYVYRALQYSQKSIQDYRQQAHALEAQGQAVDWPAVEANIRDFNNQTTQSLRSYLGDDRFGKLQNNSVFDND